MKPKKRFIRLVLMQFAYFFIIFFLLEAFWAMYDGTTYNFGRYAIKGLFMGGFIVTMLIMMYLYEFNQLGISSTDENYLNTEPKKIIHSKLTLSQIAESIRMNSEYHSVTNDENNQLNFQVSQNWKSWGEKMHISEVGKENETYIYEVSSKPSFKLTIIDYGKNLENIIKLENQISQIA